MASLYRNIVPLALFHTLSLCETSSGVSHSMSAGTKKVLMCCSGSHNDHSVIFSIFAISARSVSSYWKATSSSVKSSVYLLCLASCYH